MEKISVICPCCEAALTIDAASGAILAHEEKTKKHGSFEEMKDELDKQKQLREQIFNQETLAQKDRSRILEEKFEEARKSVGSDLNKPFKNPLDLE